MPCPASPVRVPLHDLLQHDGEEPAVPPRLVLGAAGDGVGDVAEDAIVENQCREVWRLEHVDHVHKLGRIDGVTEQM